MGGGDLTVVSSPVRRDCYRGAMNVAIVYDSRTGTTATAAREMARVLKNSGHECSVSPVAQANPDEVSNADLICVGSWTKGLFIVLQHPTKASMEFIDKLGNLRGKKAVVFCTYKLATGSLLQKMSNAIEARGADVVGQFKYRGPFPSSAFEELVASL